MSASRPAATETAQPAGWHVYVVRCRDGSLYTGIARDVTARIASHNDGSGAAYTRSRRPVSLVWSEQAADRSAALKRELQIKRLRRSDKLALIGAP